MVLFWYKSKRLKINKYATKGVTILKRVNKQEKSHNIWLSLGKMQATTSNGGFGINECKV